MKNVEHFAHKGAIYVAINTTKKEKIKQWSFFFFKFVLFPTMLDLCAMSAFDLAGAEIGFSTTSGPFTNSELVAYYGLAGRDAKTDDARVDLPRNLRELIFWPPRPHLISVRSIIARVTASNYFVRFLPSVEAGG